MDTYLKHHGILGQKWGKQNGPPYPLGAEDHSASEKKAGWRKSLSSQIDDSKDIVLKKGTKINTISLSKRGAHKLNISPNDFTGFAGAYVGLLKLGLRKIALDKRWTYFYDPENEWDSKVYKGPFGMYKSYYGNKNLYEHQMETTKDLKMPSYQKRLDTFKEVYNNNKKVTVKNLKTIQNLFKNNPKYGYDKINLEDLKTEKDWEKAYEMFNHTMENIAAFGSSKKFAKLMAKNYDAMIDDNNKGIYNDANNPIIIFKQKNFKKIEKGRLIDFDEMYDSYLTVQTALNKKGEAVKL